MLSLIDDLKQLNGMVDRLSGGSCAYPPDELASKAAEFLCIHYLNLTRIVADDAAIRAAHHDLVIRLGEVTTELEAARKDARGERGETWEVWQEDMPVAVSDSFPDAMHYLAMYQQDGPVTLKRAVVYRETITPEQLAAMKESGK